MFYRVVVLCFVFLESCFFSFSQKVEFEHISNNDGLASSEVTCILKDYKGYMWFGTFNGLSKFNGYEFTNYINDPLKKNSLNDNYIRCLLETNKKQLYIGFHYLGMCIYNRDTDDFTRLLHDSKDSTSLSHNCILSIYEDSRSNIWVGTRGGLDKFDAKTKTFKHYKPFPNNNNIVSSIIDDGSGNLWLCGHTNEICKFNVADGSFTYIQYTEKKNDIKFFYKGGVLLLDSKKNLWIGNETNGLFRYNIQSGKCESLCADNSILKSKNITKLEEDSDGNIWIGTDGGGLVVYSYKTNHYECFKNDPGDPSSISGNAVYSIYQSEPGLIWVGVYASGLNIYKKNKRKFVNYTATGNAGKSISQKSILGIAQSEGNKIWLGTDGGGLNLFDPDKNTFTYYTTKNSTINSDIIKCITKDIQGNLWLGSFGGGLGRVNMATGTARIFSGHAMNQEDLLRNEHVWALAETRDKKIWIGLLGYGLHIYDPVSSKLTYEPFDTSAVNKAVCNIFTIFEDSKNRVWIGTQGAGLGYFDPITKKITKVVLKSKDNQLLDNNEIGCIFEDSKKYNMDRNW